MLLPPFRSPIRYRCHTSDQVNFHEFYGIFDIWDGCPEQDRDSEYLANGIGIAIAAFFMIPLIRAESRNSYHGRYGMNIKKKMLWSHRVYHSVWEYTFFNPLRPEPKMQIRHGCVVFFITTLSFWYCSAGKNFSLKRYILTFEADWQSEELQTKFKRFRNMRRGKIPRLEPASENSKFSARNSTCRDILHINRILWYFEHANIRRLHIVMLPPKRHFPRPYFIPYVQLYSRRLRCFGLPSGTWGFYPAELLCRLHWLSHQFHRSCRCNGISSCSSFRVRQDQGQQR